MIQKTLPIADIVKPHSRVSCRATIAIPRSETAENDISRYSNIQILYYFHNKELTIYKKRSTKEVHQFWPWHKRGWGSPSCIVVFCTIQYVIFVYKVFVIHQIYAYRLYNLDFRTCLINSLSWTRSQNEQSFMPLSK